jgi:Flp pilus assembly pilin Flp
MKKLLAQFIHNDEGQDLIEYALLAGIITAGVTAAITAIIGKVNTRYTALDAAIP